MAMTDLASLVALHGRYRPERIAIEAGDRTLGYGALDLLVRRIAARLGAAGVGPGDVVATLMRDTPEQVAAHLAILRRGAAALPFDWRWPRPEVERALARFAPKAMLADETRADETRADEARADETWAGPVLTLDGLAGTAPDEAPPHGDARAPAFLSLSSGSTGEPKAAILTHETLLARLLSIATEGPLSRDDRYLISTPLAHGVGHLFAAYMLVLGATVVLAPPLSDAAALAETIRARRITAATIVPVQTRALLDLARARGGGRLMPELGLYMTSSAGLDPGEQAEAARLLCPRIVDFYGSIPAGVVSVGRIADPEQPRGSVGRPALGYEVQVVGEDDAPLPPGAIGRLRARGPGVAAGFMALPDGSEERLVDGWCTTGDLASLDPGGYIHLHGRTTEILKVGGRSVLAVEVERVLTAHPAVAEAAVVGAGAPGGEQVVTGFVVLRAPVGMRDLVAHCRRALAPYKVPERLYVLDALPRNTNRKVVKARLLDLIGAPGGG